jgi:hypothetical protein
MTVKKGIHYALQIFSEDTDTDWNTLTDSDVGLVDGIFQLITDNPGYDGTINIPTYGPHEINVDGSNMSGAPVDGPYKEGFLLQDAFTSDPERSVDIISCGSYKTDSAFGFKVRNDAKFWNYCKTNNISFTGRRVIMWVVIDDVFYQVARGRVVNNPYTETDYNFDVQDDANLIHKMLPPLTTNPTNNPNVIDSSSGQAIPVIFGDVPKTKLLKLESSNTFVELNKFNTSTGLNSTGLKYTLAASSSYDAPAADPITGPWILKLIVTKNIYIADDQLKDYYLSVAVGDSNISTKQMYKILSNSSTGSAPSIYPYIEISLYLAAPLLKDDGTLHAAWDCKHGEVPPGIYFEPSDHYKPNTTHGFIYWFQISKYETTAQLSYFDSAVAVEGSNGIQIYDFSSDLKEYIDISPIAKINSSGNSVKLVANQSTPEGKSSVYQYFNMQMVAYGTERFNDPGVWGVVEKYDGDDIVLVTDRDRSTAKAMSQIFDATNRYGAIFADYKPSQTIIDTSDNVYFCVDFTIVNRSSGAGIYLWYIQWIAMDIYGNEHSGSSGVTSDLIFTGPNNPNYSQVNAVPNDLITNFNATDKSNLLGIRASTTGNTFKNIFKITDTSIFSNPNIVNIRFRLVIKRNLLPGTTLKVNVKEISVVIEKQIDTIKGDLYTKATGELTGSTATDASHATNDVYHAFMHILEDYDGIPPALIDYGTLATDRSDWHVGRTLTDRKNSVNYLNELCAHSFVAMFPTRTGMRGLRSINPDIALVPEVTHDLNIIGRDSIEDFELTDVMQLFNNFLLQYNFDPGLQAFIRSFVVANIDMFATFPDPYQSVVDATLQTTSTTTLTIANNVNKTVTCGTGFAFSPSQIVLIQHDTARFMYGTIVSYDSSTGIMVVAVQATKGTGSFSTWTVGLFSEPLWYLCFGGLLGSPNFPTDGYVESKYIWDQCKNSYNVNRVVRQSQNDISQLNWFIDRALFDENTTWGTGDSSSAYYFLKILAQWVTLQKGLIPYSVPINSTTIELELMKVVGVKDIVYTNDEIRHGYIVSISPVTGKDQLRLKVLLMPTEYTPYPDPTGLNETPDAVDYVDSLDETGDIDTYVDSLLE